MKDRCYDGMPSSDEERIERHERNDIVSVIIFTILEVALIGSAVGTLDADPLVSIILLVFAIMVMPFIFVLWMYWTINKVEYE